jgi:hypothetical protein
MARSAGHWSGPEPVIKPCSDLLDAQDASSRGGKLDSQRDTVESSADVSHRRSYVVRKLHSRLRGSRPVHKQLLGTGWFQRLDDPRHFAWDGQRLAAGGQDPDPAARAQ